MQSVNTALKAPMFDKVTFALLFSLLVCARTWCGDYGEQQSTIMRVFAQDFSFFRFFCGGET